MILVYHQKDRLGRDMMNSGKIYESVEKMLGESIVPSAEVSKRYNATYGASDFNAGMLHAAMLDTSVGGCGLVMREITAQSIENPIPDIRATLQATSGFATSCPRRTRARRLGLLTKR